MTGKDENHLPFDLENMSIPELEALLQQDFIALDGGAPDVGYIMAIMEVIQKKEQARPDYLPMDAEKAWEEFSSAHIKGGGREKSACYSEEEQEETIMLLSAEHPQQQKSAKVFRRFLLSAAVICLLVAVTCFPVLGYKNVVHMMAYWTAEQFGFYLPKLSIVYSSEQTPEEYTELQTLMQERSVELFIPKFPEDFEVGEPVLTHIPDQSKVRFIVTYQKQDEFYIFSINHDECETNRKLYEKTDNFVEPCEYNGIKCYILSNVDNNTATWYHEKTEYSIITNAQISDLKEILKTIYEVQNES